jgi:hypothetical protein
MPPRAHADSSAVFATARLIIALPRENYSLRDQPFLHFPNAQNELFCAEIQVASVDISFYSLPR